MVVGVLQLELLLYAPQNLKEKRGAVRKILGRCRERFPVSAAETGQQDLWQRCELGFSMVAQHEDEIRVIFDRIEDEIHSQGSAEVIERQIEMLHY